MVFRVHCVHCHYEVCVNTGARRNWKLGPHLTLIRVNNEVTPWSIVIIEKLTVSQLTEKLSTF